MKQTDNLTSLLRIVRDHYLNLYKCKIHFNKLYSIMNQVDIDELGNNEEILELIDNISSLVDLIPSDSFIIEDKI